MGAHKTITLVTGLFFLFIFLTGFWVRRDGKPYSMLILTIHKFISLAAGIVLGIALYRLNQAVGFSPSEVTAVLVTGMLFVATVLSGGIWSIEKEIPTPILWLHHVSPLLTMLSTGVVMYLVI